MSALDCDCACHFGASVVHYRGEKIVGFCYCQNFTRTTLEPPKESESNQVTVLDKGFLALDAHLADDLAVVNAARVSFNQTSDELDEKGKGLINFLMRERHGTPFEHGFFRFIVKCPLFVAREWHRHRVGHSYNEWSGRYSQIEPEYYVPEKARRQTGKPGAYTFEEYDDPELLDTLDDCSAIAFMNYEYALGKGVAKEQARLFLPINTYTKFYWSCNPRSLMHFISLRNSEQAMKEIREYASAAEEFFSTAMPVTYGAFCSNGKVAP